MPIHPKTIMIRKVLDRLREYTLELQPEKCEFLRKEVNYLGNQITKFGVKPDPETASVFKNFPMPTMAKQL
jgi:hypothetical protein